MAKVLAGVAPPHEGGRPSTLSLGLVALETLRGSPFIPASATRTEALRTLSSADLQATLRTATSDLPEQRRRHHTALLSGMLQVSPEKRKSAK